MGIDVRGEVLPEPSWLPAVSEQALVVWFTLWAIGVVINLLAHWTENRRSESTSAALVVATMLHAFLFPPLAAILMLRRDYARSAIGRAVSRPWVSTGISAVLAIQFGFLGVRHRYDLFLSANIAYTGLWVLAISCLALRASSGRATSVLGACGGLSIGALLLAYASTFAHI
jgi:hypothetical protein